MRPDPTIVELENMRLGAEIQSMKPYMDAEIEGLQRAVVSSVLSAVNNGSLTQEMALTKWHEYISYTKLKQKYEQRIRVGQSTHNLDFTQKVG